MGKHAIDIHRLTPSERLDLIDELWSSLEDGDVPLTESQQRELDCRVDRLAETGPTGSPIDDVVGRLKAPLG